MPRTCLAILPGLLTLAATTATPALQAQGEAPVNRVIEALREGRPALGTFSRAARPDLDFVVIDEQYGDFEVGTVREALAGMRTSTGPAVAAPIVRTPLAARDAPRAPVSQVLDVGALGVMFPDIETPEQARTAIASMRLAPPAGGAAPFPGLRGSDFGTAPRYWGLSDDAYRARADVWPLDPDGSLIAMIQIESLAGIERLDDILDVPGIGVIFLGPTDIATSIGADGPNAPRVEALVQRVLASCIEREVACGYPIVAATPDDAERQTAGRLAEGFKVLAVMTSAR